ncbi:MAG: bifunctional riboflavin kinase/FAD synthetase [Lachnospiraceae bacterium]|nr:bifunctional riboflavin kinase/FAD synthetase [Lachnospiraceae bacterium]
MEYIKGTTEFVIERESVVTLGKFDGIHRGHSKLLDKVKELAGSDYRKVLFTFSVHPKVYLKGETPKVLMTNAERYYYMEKEGWDYLIEYPFVEETASMEPEDFVEEVLIKQLSAAHVVVGVDFRFGHKRRGTIDTLRRYERHGCFQVHVVAKEQYEDRDISSTLVRSEVEMGRMEEVTKLLGHPYTITGKVEYGRQLGRTLGIPTTNLMPSDNKLLPPYGVYFTKTIFQGKTYKGITNIGCKPTIADELKRGVETYLFDFSGDLYGELLTVELYKYHRPEMKFPHIHALKQQMEQDIETAKKYDFEKGGV